MHRNGMINGSRRWTTMNVVQRRRSPFAFSCTIANVPVELAPSFKYFGVTLSNERAYNSLGKWKLHAVRICYMGSTPSVPQRCHWNSLKACFQVRSFHILIFICKTTILLTFSFSLRSRIASVLYKYIDHKPYIWVTVLCISGHAGHPVGRARIQWHFHHHSFTE